MKSLKIVHNLFFLLLTLIFVGIQELSGQCSTTLTYDLAGGTTLDNVTDNICPYTTYTITVPASSPALFFDGSADVILNGGSAGGTACTPATTTGTTTITFRIDNSTTGSAHSIQVSDEAGSGGCAQGANICTYNFVLSGAYIVNIPDQTVCDQTDFVINPNSICQGTCSTPANTTWAWDDQINGGAADGSTESHTINSATYNGYITPPGSFNVRLTTTYDNGGLVCTYVDDFAVNVSKTPNLTMTPISFASSSGGTSGDVCINAQENVTATCSNCTNGVDDVEYTWYHGSTAFPTLHNSIPNGVSTTTGNHTYTIDPEVGTYVPNTTTPLLSPGAYTISVSADLNGCIGGTSGTLNVNDRPAVEIGWYSQDGASSLGDGYYPNSGSLLYNDTNQICAGSGIELFARNCRGSFTGNQSFANYTGPGIANRFATSCPCLSSDLTTVNCASGGNYYKTMTWGVHSSNPAANAGLSVTPVASPSLGATSNCDVVFTQGASEVLTYALRVEDANGCINSDSVKILATVSGVEFKYDNVVYPTTSNPSISVCSNEPALSIRGSGINTSNDDVVPFDGSTDAAYSNTTTYTWAQTPSVSSSSLDIASGASTRTITTDPPAASNVGNTTNYQLTMTDGWGCVGIGNVDVSVSDIAISIPGTHAICYNEALVITNTDHALNPTAVYDVYNVNPATNTSTSPILSNQSHPITINNPSATTYYVVIKLGTCTNTASTSVSINPEIVWQTLQSTPDPLVFACNDQATILEAHATGGTGLLIYDWVATGLGQGNVHTSTGGSSVMGTASNNGSTGYYQWVFTGFFPRLVWVTTSTTDNSFTYHTNLPAQTGTTNVLTVTDNGGTGCSITHTFSFDIIECGVPVLDKTKTVFSTPGYALDLYGCIDDVINLTCRINTSGGAALGYTPKYEWSTGLIETGTTSSTNIPITASSPDTIFTFCKVTDSATDEIVGVVFDTTIVSRGNINLYPLGDNNSATVDTSICLNEVVEATANCPECRGHIEYIWAGGSSGSIQTYGSTYDAYYFSGTVPNSTFAIPLTVRHGEAPNYCTDAADRQVAVDTLPNIQLMDVNGSAIVGPRYLCDGAVDTISINTLSCPTCYTYQWNTSANTETIYVSSQGGYYAEVVDGNSCKGVTDIALIIDANDGLNSSVVANPSQVCSGNNVILEVAPCVGCSYKWYDVNPLPTGTELAPTRLYSTDSVRTYYAEVTNYHGCVYQTAQIALSSTNLITPIIAGTTDSICLGESSRLSTASGPGYNFQWYLEGNVISGATDSFYVASDSGSYTVHVTHTNGCIGESAAFHLASISYKPNLIVIDSIVCSGQTADLMTDLYPNWQYQWYDDGIPILGANGSIYQATSPGSHYVEVTTDYLCVVRSDSVRISTSSLSTPNATTATPSICPGDRGELSVSLCTGCFYQWFDENGSAVTGLSKSNYRHNFFPTLTKKYYAEVSINGCLERSDTVEIIVNSVFTPAITASSSVVCDGLNSTLITQGCVGCSYTWLHYGFPIPGSLNDTFHLVSNISDIGDYQIAVDYPNGCADTSTILTINDGSYSVALTINGGPPIDSVICNGVGETLLATPSQSLTGTYLYTFFRNNAPVTAQLNSNTYLGNNAGVYTVEAVDPLGCRALSNLLPLRAVNIVPVLNARATSDPNSVTAEAICTDSGTVFMEVTVPNCSSCTYEWRKGSASTIISTGTTYTTPRGALGAGLYTVSATSDGCGATTQPKNIANSIGTINSNANTTDTSICNGQSVTLEHDANSGTTASCPTCVVCTGCTYRWLRNGNPINGANSFQYITSTPGLYNLELTTATGCVDTSGVITIRQVDPPVGLSLNFDSLIVGTSFSGTGTPLASNGDTIDMNNWVFPEGARHDSLGSGASSYFSSAPFNASLNCNGVLPCNPGLAGVDSVYFIPNDTLAGYHLITYHYDTLGCSFTVDDVLEVLPPGDIIVTNTNPASVPYEACVGDSLVINTVNLNYPIDQVYAFDVNDNYIQLPLGSVVTRSDTFGFTVRWSTTIGVNVPGFANASYLKLVNSATNDSTFTSFVLIHNTDLSFTGLPNTLCSNGTGVTLFGNPAGGSFYATTAGNPSAVLPGVVVGDTLYPNLLNSAAYSNGNQWIDVYYSYTETYTNGNLCPSNDTFSVLREVKDVRLTSVKFNTISVSQPKELLTNLVYQVTPYEARPNKQPLYTSSFSGSFTNPAGSPTEFLPALAGVGKHALTYSIESGSCINSVEDSITVVPAPTPIPFPDTICRNYGTVNFSRDGAFPYGLPNVVFPMGGVTYTDTVHIMSATAAGIVLGAGNPNPPSMSFVYDPTLVSGNYDTLVIEYRYRRSEDTLGVDFDTLDYVVGQIIKPIYIEDLSSAMIIDTIVSSFYCQEDILHLLAGSPSNNAFGGGLFMLYGGNYQYQFGDTLLNNVINPYAVNHLENATTTYDLVYTLNGAACRNSDTLQVTISKGLNPSFTTVNGLKEFCDTDPEVMITHNVALPDTAIWKIGGIPQASYVFPPNPLDSGIHVVELQMVSKYIQAPDTFTCTASVLDTFTIHPLPSLTVTPGLNTQYCANDPVVDFIVSPSPGCPIYASSGHYVLDENFDLGIPNWTTTNVFSGKPWVQTTILPQGGGGQVAFIDTSSVLDNSWLISPSFNLVTGHRYRLTFMVQAGALNPSCVTGVCDAAMVVALGTSANPASMSTQLWYSDTIKNDLTYVRYTADIDPALFTGGQHNIGFRSVTPAFGRSLRLDNVVLRDMTIGSCSQAGIGYIDGTGVHNVQDSAYQFNPLAGDIGTSNIKYVYTDIKGCQDSLVYTVKIDTAPVVRFTNLDSSYCENLPTLFITGSPLGGNFSSTVGTNLTGIPNVAPLDTAFFPVQYQLNTSGTDIVSYVYTDNNGCTETARDTVVVVPLVDSNIISPALDPSGNGHCEYHTSATLSVSAASGAYDSTGIFYGPGIRNGAGGVGVATFHPDSAVIDMGHTGDVHLSYVYSTTTGCIDTARFVTTVHAAPKLAFVNLSDSLCLNQDTFVVQAQNTVVTGSTGQITYTSVLGVGAGTFTFQDVNGSPLNPDPMPLFDRLIPSLLAGHNKVHVSYNYQADPNFGNCSSTIYDSIRVDSIPNVYFQGLRPYYCENEPSSVFFGFPPYNVGSGYLLIDSNQIDSSFYWIDPSVLVGAGLTTGVHPTYYTFTDGHGCRGEVFDTFEVRPYPRVTFNPNYQDTFCRQIGTYDLTQVIASPAGGFFTDNLALTSIRNDTLLDLNSLAGPRVITYHYTDPVTQCYNEASFTIHLFNGPGADFTVYGGCAQMDITFSGSATNLEAGIDSITNVWWDFEGNGTRYSLSLDTSNITIKDTSYSYTTNGTYNVKLYVQNQGHCIDSISKPLIISPYYNLANDYFEDFNTNAGDWYNDQIQSANVATNDIWTRESSINGARIISGNGAWVTTADSLYAKDQQAWVYSPCFDFTSSNRPMIAFDLWRDVLDGIDGVVLEYYNNTTNEWSLIGDVGQGINWYQSDFVLSRPGNQANITYPRGWTGRSNGYESVRLRLDQFKGQRDIRFRLAFSTSPQTVIDTVPGNGYEGAAFDNVWIGERTRNVLVEHFENEDYQTDAGNSSDVVDRSVYDKIFNTYNGLDVILIQYQVDEDGQQLNSDQFFARNTADLGARKWYYGAEPNRAYVDGRKIGSGQSDSLNTWDLDYDMLQFPDFKIDIDSPLTVVGTSLTVNATIEALVPKDSADYIVHAVVIQDSFNINKRGFNMLSVARKMLPDNSGTLENHGWVVGQTSTLTQSWGDYSGEIGHASFDPTQLEAIVFVQNHSTKEIYQVATTQNLNKYTGTKKIEDEVATEIFSLNVYPNPSSDLFNVEFEKELEGDYDWRLIDITGRVLQAGTASNGTRKFTIDAERLIDGAYFFVINSDDNHTYAQRKLVVIK